MFLMDDNGSIIPVGGKQRMNAYPNNKIIQWKDGNELNLCNESSVGSGFSCAGSVADNDWKVIYKY